MEADCKTRLPHAQWENQTGHCAAKAAQGEIGAEG
jgi:hypothetical protein